LANRPHLVLFNPDHWRGDVMGHLGNPAAVTPNLDALVASEGVSFSRAFCQSPVCTPSRCSFMSGWYPHVRGHRTQAHMLRRGEPVLLKALKDAGYFVWWGGKNDLVPAQNGFDAYCSVKYTPTGALRPNVHLAADWRGDPGSDTYYSFYAGRLDTGGEEVYFDHDWAHITGAIEQIKDRPKDRPLCLFLPILYPHLPYGVEEPWYSRIDRGRLSPRLPTPQGWRGKPSMLQGIHARLGMQTWSEERWAALRATYYGMCARVDHQFGMVMQALRDAGIYDDTAVFFFSDHGDFAGDYGLVDITQNTFEDCLTKVPLIIKPPVGVPLRAGQCDALTELVDVPATIETLAGLSPAHTHFGRSLLPLLAGETDGHRDAVFAEGGRLHGEDHCMEAAGAWGEPGGFYWPRLSQQRSTGPEHTKAVMCRTNDYKYVRRLYEQDELYDLEDDPGELHNRIDDPALGDALASLKERLLEFYLETTDVVPWDADQR